MQKSVIAITIGVFVVVSAGSAAVWYLFPHVGLRQSVSLLQPKPVVMIQSDLAGQEIHTNRNFPNAPTFFEETANITGAEQSITIILTDDETKAETPFFVDGKVVSGFSFPNPQNIYQVVVYIAPEVRIDYSSLQYELSRNYLLSLLYASEYKKYLDDPTYQPSYSEAIQLAGEINREARSTNMYPIEIRQQQ